MVRRPDFFIVGAPKCGTTSLYAYLASHPQVFMPENKEPCFLAKDFSCSLYPQTEEDYLKMFVGAEAHQKMGEATSTYLYSRTAAEHIKRFNPEAKIIVLLRDPVEMIQALHQQRLFEGAENIQEFEAALEAEAERSKGQRIPKGFSWPQAYLQYRAFGTYAEQLARYFERFDRSSVHVIWFEDFTMDTPRCFAGVCEFLGISREHSPDYEVHNPNKRWKSLLVRDLMLSAPARLLRRNLPAFLRRGLKQVVVKEGRRAPLAEQVERALRDYYAADLKRLEQMLNRDLAAWR